MTLGRDAVVLAKALPGVSLGWGRLSRRTAGVVASEGGAGGIDAVVKGAPNLTSGRDAVVLAKALPEASEAWGRLFAVDENCLLREFRLRALLRRRLALRTLLRLRRSFGCKRAE